MASGNECRHWLHIQRINSYNAKNTEDYLPEHYDVHAVFESKV